MDFISKLDWLMKRDGLNKHTLAQKSGVPYTTIVGLYERGHENARLSTLNSLCSFFDVPLDYLVLDAYDKPEDFTPSGNPTAISLVELKSVPIVGTIACGEPITAVENIEGTAQVAAGTHADFALRCKGDSMYPLLNDGDLVFIRQQDTVDDGQIAAVLIDGEATLKHLYRQPNGVLLVAENHRYAPITAAEDVRVIGKAVAFQRAI